MINVAKFCLACALFLCLSQSPAFEFETCGALENAYGPFDYTNPEHRKKKLRVVERFHFDTGTEYLTKSLPGGFGGNIDYTLRAFPNHHRALGSMVNLAIREKRQKPTGANFTVDCYFDRAIRFKPDDPTVRMVYGLYLHKLNKIQPAIKELVAADQLRPNDANINYNLGLLYFDTKDYEKAMQRAKRAYALGFGLSGLKIKLQRVGKWSD